MVESIADYICDQDAHGLRIARYGRLNVFMLLLETNELLLTDTEPVTCQYNQLLSWRKLAKEIGNSGVCNVCVFGRTTWIWAAK